MNSAWQNLKKLDKAFRVDPGVVKISKANTLKHEMAKLEIAYELALKDHVFVTEARFEGNLRGDVYDATMDELWEVETDQSERNLKKKLETRYPVQRVWIIDPNKDIKNQM